jgi:hypothetical protein
MSGVALSGNRGGVYVSGFFTNSGGAVHKLNAVDPQLETARLQPLSLPLDPSRNVISWFFKISFKCNLHRYAAAS